MTNEEVKECFRRQEPVEYEGIIYDKINAIIYRIDPKVKKIIVSAELLDKTKNCIVIARVFTIKAVIPVDSVHDSNATYIKEEQPADIV